MKKYSAFSLLLLPVFSFLVGCASLVFNPHPPDTIVTLDLIPSGNNMVTTWPWPPSIFVERDDGIALNPNIAVGYVPGIAILVVENCSDKAQTLGNWTDQRWKLVLELKGSSSRVLQLVRAGRTLPSFPRPPMVLEPGMKASIVVGVADCLPFNEQHMEAPLPTCKMHVEYADGLVTYRSNEFFVQCR